MFRPRNTPTFDREDPCNPNEAASPVDGLDRGTNEANEAGSDRCENPRWCLMSNHVHLIAVPGRSDSLSILMRRVHGRQAQYYNAHTGRTGPLWQNRFYGCMLAPNHLLRRTHPVRARMARHAEDYLWSSAIAQVTGGER